MCGIAGIAVSQSDQNLGGALERMLSTNPWRGPDATGIFVLDRLALGHHRLSIVDLDLRSNQPMIVGGLTLVFNGEIYNFKQLKQELRHDWVFTTESDSEVILAAYQKWGRSCVHRFNGDWAFAIFDQEKNQLFLSRDRFGIKPLYYRYQGGELHFASEARAIVAVAPSSVSDQNILDFLVRGINEQISRTMYDDINSLPPGHNLIYSFDKSESPTLEKYYGEEQIFNAQVPGTLEQAIELFGALLEDAVLLRFNADVEVGVCLSGGLDSSLIAAVLAKSLPSGQLHTFTGVAPRYAGDESGFASIVAQSIGSRHLEIPLVYEDVSKYFEKMVTAMDSPVAGINPLGRYKVLHEAKKFVTVVLDGQGGDELLAGYHRFHDLHIDQVGSSFLSRRSNSFKSTVKSNRRSALSSQFDGALKPSKREVPKLVRSVDSVTNAQFNALCGSGLLSLLHTEDRLTMAQSMEGRVPLLDHRLVELCMSAPLAFRISGDQDKLMAREYARRTKLVPDQIIDRRDKLGFSTPYGQMEKTRAFFSQYWLSKRQRKVDIFNVTKVLGMIESSSKGAPQLLDDVARITSLDLFLAGCE